MLQAAQIIPTPLTPPLKWAGGKRWLVPRLARLWLPYSANHRLVEPFVGGMSVALGLQPRQALLNDVNQRRDEIAKDISLAAASQKLPLNQETTKRRASTVISWGRWVVEKLAVDNS